MLPHFFKNSPHHTWDAISLPDRFYIYLQAPCNTSNSRTINSMLCFFSTVPSNIILAQGLSESSILERWVMLTSSCAPPLPEDWCLVPLSSTVVHRFRHFRCHCPCTCRLVEDIVQLNCIGSGYKSGTRVISLREWMSGYNKNQWNVKCRHGRYVRSSNPPTSLKVTCDNLPPFAVNGFNF